MIDPKVEQPQTSFITEKRKIRSFQFRQQRGRSFEIAANQNAVLPMRALSCWRKERKRRGAGKPRKGPSSPLAFKIGTRLVKFRTEVLSAMWEVCEWTSVARGQNKKYSAKGGQFSYLIRGETCLWVCGECACGDLSESVPERKICTLDVLRWWIKKRQFKQCGRTMIPDVVWCTGLHVNQSLIWAFWPLPQRTIHSNSSTTFPIVIKLTTKLYQPTYGYPSHRSKAPNQRQRSWTKP